MAAPQAAYPVNSTDNCPIELSLEFIVGATGAVPTTGGTSGTGITGGREMGTPVRNGVGDYSFPLSGSWVRLRDGRAFTVGATSTTTGKIAHLITDSVTSLTAPLVRFQFVRIDTGAAAEVTQNDVIKVTLSLISKSP